jgi:hypothetical protein
LPQDPDAADPVDAGLSCSIESLTKVSGVDVACSNCYLATVFGVHPAGAFGELRAFDIYRLCASLEHCPCPRGEGRREQLRSLLSTRSVVQSLGEKWVSLDRRCGTL